jgi:hypothetical protein
MGAPAATKQAIARAVEAVRECGIPIGRVTVTKGGDVIVDTVSESVDTKGGAAHRQPKQWTK